MARVTFDTMTRALGILAYKGKETIYFKSVDWKTISPMVQAFNRARTPEEKKKFINEIVKQVQYQHYLQMEVENKVRAMRGQRRINLKKRKL